MERIGRRRLDTAGRAQQGNQELLRPLSEAARAILADQPRVSQFVFPTDATHCLTNFGYYKRHFDKAWASPDGRCTI